MQAPTRIPLPADLPAPWQQPGDELAFWTADRMHFPRPITQLDTVMTDMIFSVGLNHGFETYSFPLRATCRRFWSHLYMSVAPRELSADEFAALEARSRETLDAAMGRLLESWETAWLPEITRILDGWERFDLRGAPLPALLAHLDDTLRDFRRLWELHFELVMPSQLAVSLFDEFYRELFGDADPDPFGAYALLQGFDHMTLRAGAELWTLSRAAHASPAVRTALETHAAADVPGALAASADGRAFLEQLRAYLDEHGRRGDTWGLSYASWIEDPTPVIKNLTDYLSGPDHDPELALAELAAERERLVATARDRLRVYPEATRRQFEFLLKAAQEGNFVAEEHNHWIDFRATHRVRQVFLELGRRFAEAGAIERADDVMHLTLDEVRETARRPSDTDLRPLVAAREAEIARHRDAPLPPAIGVEPPGPPPMNPMTQTNAKFWGTPASPSDDPRVLNGAAGSPGVARGPARVVRSLAEAGRLRAGDILVTESTAPPWTPLFATVAAVVTDTGGVLSHCAVIAREYRLPAVVSVGVATSRIADGQLIEVDGDRGVVRLLDGD